MIFVSKNVGEIFWGWETLLVGNMLICEIVIGTAKFEPLRGLRDERWRASIALSAITGETRETTVQSNAKAASVRKTLESKFQCGSATQ